MSEVVHANVTVKHLLKNVWRLLKPFWVSKEAWKGWALLALILTLTGGSVYMSKLLNEWNNGFYNAVQALDYPEFKRQLWRFSWLAATAIIIAVHNTYFRQMLEIIWRRWLTEKMQADWLSGQNHYRLQLTDSQTDNPDQRIAEDVAEFVSSSLRLFLDTLRDIATFLTFVSVLWGLSGPISFMLGSQPVTIPGYMVWVAVLYAVLGTAITILIGRPLVRLNFLQQRFEADFRFGLVRLRENSESVALYGGEAREDSVLRTRFTEVVGNFWRLMKKQKMLGFFTSGYYQIAIIFPFVVSAPRYFAKEIQLGGLMQIASAFGRVQEALSSLVDNFTVFARWKSVVDRLATFQQSLDRAAALPVLKPARVGAALSVAGLSVLRPDGHALIAGQDWQLQAGERLLVQGPSGCGKSTLMRALAGIWPYAHGEVNYPQDGEVLFLSQKPYLPLGSLREALYYPAAPTNDERELLDLLALAGLADLTPRLDEVAPWGHILSLGEQQRVAFIRALLVRPRVLFMDEASSALDAASEERLYTAIRDRLADAIIVSVGHRESLNEYHNRTLRCVAPATWQLA